VQQLRVFTVGGVVRAGEPIMDIAPSGDELLIQARVDPADADRVSSGMKVEVRFPSFHYWGGQVTRGSVRSISRDRIVNEQAKDSYFAAEVLVDRSTIPGSINDRLTAGIGADVVIPTAPRTVAQFLVAPLFERFYLSMRER
jgi:multidrug efflux pump subunit AcrA (membrane-fusion protein)